MYFEGTAPFALRTNDESSDEYHAHGYRRLAISTTNYNKLVRYPWQPPETTTISGDRIKTGKLQSNNWADGGVTGSEFDLNEGTIRLGGDAPNTSILLSGSGGGHFLAFCL